MGRTSGGVRGGKTEKPRMNIQRGTDEYWRAQQAANQIESAANKQFGDYLRENSTGAFGGGNGVAAAIDRKIDREMFEHEWEFVNHKLLSAAISHIEKKGNDFEKSVAASVKKSMRLPSDNARQLAFVSPKQAWVLGKALIETHWNWKY